MPTPASAPASIARKAIAGVGSTPTRRTSPPASWIPPTSASLEPDARVTRIAADEEHRAMFRLLRQHRDGGSAEPARELCRELGAGDTPDPVGPEETRHGSLMLPAKGRGPGPERPRPAALSGSPWAAVGRATRIGARRHRDHLLGRIDGGRYVARASMRVNMTSEAPPGSTTAARRCCPRRSRSRRRDALPRSPGPGRPGAAAPPEA